MPKFKIQVHKRERGTKVTGRPLPGGHNLQEDVPEMVEEEVRGLIKT